MRITKITLGLCALLLFAGPVFAQNDEDRKVTVDIEVDEDGKTKKVKKEFILKDGQTLEEALEDLGILDELGAIENDERLEIDIRRIFDDVEKDMQFRFYSKDGDGMVFGDCGPKAQLGVHLDSDDDGACVTKVVEGSAAEEAGLKVGDCITRINTTAINNDTELIEAIRNAKIGEEVVIAYTREGKKQSTKATLKEEQNSFSFMWKGDELPDNWAENLNSFNFNQEATPFLGVQGDASDEGLLISRVIEGTAAERAGLEPGDIIQSFEGEEISGIGSLSRAIEEHEIGDEVEMTVIRSGKKVKLQAELGEHQSKHNTHSFRFDTDDDVQLDFDWNDDMTFDFDVEGLSPEDEEELRESMEKLEEQMQALQEQFQDYGSEIRREMRVIINAEELSEDEKKLLKKSGVSNLNKELDIDLNLFPNPSDGLFQLSFTPSARGDLSVEVFDTEGKQVYLEKLIDVEGPYNGRIDLSSRADGNYYLVVSHNGKTATRKLSKQ